MGWRTSLKGYLTIRNKLFREAMAEFIGTFILISFGDGSVAQYVFGGSKYGEFLSVNWCWGIGVTMGVFFSGGVSGGHINPAVTLTMAVLGRLPWIKVPVYMLAQYLGAFIASACVFAVYYDALNQYDGGVRQILGDKGTAGIWSTYPQDHVSTAGCFVDQVFGTALLLGCILAITDPHNMSPAPGLRPFLIGLLVHVLGAAYGYNCGYPINPARDLAPRIFTAMAGWGIGTFSHRNWNYFWVPIVGPHVGAILGAFIYQVFIGLHWPEEPKLHEANGEQVATRDTPDRENIAMSDSNLDLENSVNDTWR